MTTGRMTGGDSEVAAGDGAGGEGGEVSMMTEVGGRVTVVGVQEGVHPG
jgi:hypothetical protein